MRVIKPKQSAKKTKSHKKSLLIVSIFVGLCVIFAGFIFARSEDKSANKASQQSNNQTQLAQAESKKGILKQFTGEQFKQLYNGFAYPNTQKISDVTPITGDSSADAKIRQIATNRGYQLRSAPVTDTFQSVSDGFVLQQRAVQPWKDLVADAQKDGINLGLTAGYRSAEDQKAIFLSRLAQQNIDIAAIPSGAFDTQISQVLRTTAVPGYSRHHTGYTVDISCKNMPGTSFLYSSCFSWLSANNYEKVKTFGWIPSYPEGAGQQGPDPESWEYVWVGKDAVTE